MDLLSILFSLVQVAFLKDTLARKDGEIELLMLRDNKTQRTTAVTEKYAILRHSSSSPGIPSLGGTTRTGPQLSRGMPSIPTDKASSHSDHTQDSENYYMVNGGNKVQNLQTDADAVGFRDADIEDRLSDISDSVLSVGTETDASVSSSTDFALFSESNRTADAVTGKMYAHFFANVHC